MGPLGAGTGATGMRTARHAAITSPASPVRIVGLLLLALLATALMQSCGGGADPKGESPGDASGSSPAPTPAPAPSPTPAPAPTPAPVAPPRDATPTAIAAHAGADQTAQVNSTLGIAPAVRVTARDGQAVPGVVITFSVLSGGGSVSGATRGTDANGVATVGSWTLGSSVGEQKLVTRSAGLPEVTFRAHARAASGSGTMAPEAGTDHQTAQAGAALTLAPAVRVLRPDSVPEAGLEVTFAVTSGGGMLQTTSTVTDADGRAGAERWTLGPTLGTQTVSASAQGYTPVSFTATAFGTGAPNFTRSVWLDGLAQPWDIAFAPDGAVLYTERTLGLSVRTGDGGTRLLFSPADLVFMEQDGMLGLALDPLFASNRTLYVYMASNIAGATDNRIVRLVVNADYSAVSSRTDILTGIRWDNGTHQGGRLRFGPDGLLYVTTGDNRVGTVPQDLATLGGKVLRVTREGAAAAGNNTPAGGDPRIYTYGLRNPQGIAFRAGGVLDAGRPYLCEHGPGEHDEVTPLLAGGNGGWDPRPNTVTGLCPDGSEIDYCGYSGTDMTDLAAYPAALPPIWRSEPISQGLSGCGFVSGLPWRDWDGALAIAMLSGRRLEILRLSDAGAVTQIVRLLDTLGERLRHVETGPDGSLWVLTDGKSGGDEIWRLVPSP